MVLSGMARQCDRLAERGPGPPGGRGVCGSASALTERPRLFKIVVYVYRTIWQRSKGNFGLEIRALLLNCVSSDGDDWEFIENGVLKSL